jgi:hypothetical protein
MANGAAAGTVSSTSTATCAAGKILLGGGATVANGGQSRAAVQSSAPSGTNAWQATATVVVSGAGLVSVTAFAICSS